MTTYTYSIQMTDSERAPAWMTLCTTATPGNQDSGRVRYTVTTERHYELEAALTRDDDVIDFDRLREIRDADRLIERSVSHTEIVTAEYTSSLAVDLAASCDDSVDANGTMEFWGTDEDGSEWRVHLTGPRVDGSRDDYDV